VKIDEDIITKKKNERGDLNKCLFS
jgi:hypothetical protein